MTDLQQIVDRIDKRIRELDRKARKARKEKSFWETVHTSRILGLLDVRSFLVEQIKSMQGAKDESQD